MYDQGNLGDCFLLRFTAGKSATNLLIDFGSYTANSENEKKIARHIRKTIGNEPMYIALTHQHKDHLSGFISAKEELNKPRPLNVPQLWLSFLDDDSNPAARKLKGESEKYWNKNARIKKLAKKKFGKEEAVKRMLQLKDGYDLFAEEQTGGEAISNLLEWAKDVKFLEPGNVFDLPGLPEGTVRVYVLGPPADFQQLKKLDPSAGEQVNGVMELMQLDVSSSLMLSVLKSLDKPQGDADEFPFSKHFSTGKKPGEKFPSDHPHSLYHLDTEKWRRIDHDWLGEMGRLSLHMDSLTNNTSLVLAFELVSSKKVLLFAGDAQIGNWKSWSNIKFNDHSVTTDELLRRTVFYKAGHHSSTNATLAQSLDAMNEKELVIFIPVNEKLSTAYKFHMLKPPMMKGYNRKAKGRIIRSDLIYHQPGKNMKGYKYKFADHPSDFNNKLFVSEKGQRYVEYTVE